MVIHTVKKFHNIFKWYEETNKKNFLLSNLFSLYKDHYKINYPKTNACPSYLMTKSNIEINHVNSQFVTVFKYCEIQ